MNKIVRLIALAAVVGTAVLSYSLPQTKTTATVSDFPFPIPPLPQNAK